MLPPALLELLRGTHAASDEAVNDARWGWGCVFADDVSTAQGSIGLTSVKITGFTQSDDDGYWITASHADDSLTLRQGGVYLVGLQVSNSGSVSTEFNFHIAVGGSITTLGFHRVIGTGGDVGSGMCACPRAFAAGSVLTAMVRADGTGKSITVVDAQLWAVRLGPS